MQSPLVRGFGKGIRPPADLPAEEWVARHVRLGSWARSPKLDLDATPWMVPVFRDAESNEVRTMVLRWPTGSGKSTFFEGLIAWIVAEDPGPTQCSHKTDDQSRRWVETRAVKVLELSDPTREILQATHRHKKRKLELVLPHMFVLFGGANIGRLQDVSIQWVLAQEAWCFEEGMIGEAIARTHSRWNSRVIMCGQGAVMGHDFEILDSDCEQNDWAFVCPACKKDVLFLPRLEDPCEAFERRMVWDKEAAAEDEVDWEVVAETVRLRCDCGEEFRDEVGARRLLTGSGRYVAADGRHKPRHKSYSFPRMAIWWIPWWESVEKYITARKAEARGDVDLLRQWVQKDMGRHYEERAEVAEFEAGDYSRQEYYPTAGAPAPRWPDESLRTMTIDVQKREFWAVIRAWRPGGASRLLWEGKISTIEAVRDLQQRYEVPNWSVGIDSRYRPEDVARWRMRYAGKDGKDIWTMLMGEDQDRGYPVHARRMVDGKAQTVTVYRPFSQWVKARTADGVGYRFVKHSNLRIKDLAAGIMASEELEWGVMNDHSPDYAKHMRAEVKREIRPGRMRWEKLRPHLRNDLWDCECMGVVLACIKGVLRFEE